MGDNITRIIKIVYFFYMLKIEGTWYLRQKQKEENIQKLRLQHEKLRDSPRESDNRDADILLEHIRAEIRGLANLRTLYSALVHGGADPNK